MCKSALWDLAGSFETLAIMYAEMATLMSNSPDQSCGGLVLMHLNRKNEELVVSLYKFAKEVKK